MAIAVQSGIIVVGSGQMAAGTTLLPTYVTATPVQIFGSGGSSETNLAVYEISGIQASNTFSTVASLVSFGSASGAGWLMGLYNPGVYTVEVTRISIYNNTAAPGVTFNVSRASGAIVSGGPAVIHGNATANPASTVSGYLASGPTVVANSGLKITNSTYVVDYLQPSTSIFFDRNYRATPFEQGIIVASGESLLIGIYSGVTAALTDIALWWIER